MVLALRFRNRSLSRLLPERLRPWDSLFCPRFPKWHQRRLPERFLDSLFPNVAGLYIETSFRHLIYYHLCNPGNPVAPGNPVVISAIVKAAVLEGFAPANLG